MCCKYIGAGIQLKVQVGMEDSSSACISAHNWESPAQFENPIKPPEYEGALLVVLCTIKLHIVSWNWRKEN